MTPPFSPYVFVYGTLKPGHRNAHWATAIAEPLAALPATLPGFALHHLGRYPGIVPAAGAEVRGVLYRYPPEQLPAVLAHMDELEDYRGPQHPENLYHRERGEVTLQSGERVSAWVYVYACPLPPESRIEGSEWTADHERQQA